MQSGWGGEYLCGLIGGEAVIRLPREISMRVKLQGGERKIQ